MRRMITGEQITKINKLNQVDANPTAEATELLDKVQIGDTVYSLEGGVKSVNGQIGNVVLTASDIKADDQTTIQENIDRIDADIARVEGNIPDITPLATKEEVAAVANDLSNHTSNDTIHVTASDKETWNNKVNQGQIADMATKDELSTELAKKQDVIDDLDTIRSGAKKGATAVQPATLDNYVTLDTIQTVPGNKTFDYVTANNYEAKNGVASNYINTVTLNATNQIITPKIYAEETVTIGKIVGDDTSHLFIRPDGSITFEKGFDITKLTTVNLPKKVGIFTLATTDDIDNAHNDINNSIWDINNSISDINNSISDITTNYVTTDTAQTIKGAKTFQSTVTAPNLTAQGTNESTVYGSAQMVHTFKDNTKLNLQYPKKSGNQTIATVSDLSGKLDKVTSTTELSQVYAKAPSGANEMINCNTLQTSLPSLLMRDEYGNCKIVDPLDEWDIANKKYVDNAVASFDISNLVTLNTEQTITANKKIQGNLDVQGSFDIKRADNTTAFSIYNNQKDRILLEGGKQVGNSSVRSRYNLPIADTDIHKTIATVDQIPDTSKFVTTDTEQTINANKTIKGTFSINRADNSTAFRLYNNQADNISFAGWKTVNSSNVRTWYNLPLYDTQTSKTIATTDEFNYQNGDTYSNTGFYCASGHITGGGKQILITIPVHKDLKNIKSVTVSKLSAVIRGVGGYVNGTQYIDYAHTTGYTVKPIIASPNTISLQIIKNTDFGGSNNTPVSLAFNNGGIYLIFSTQQNQSE